MDIDYNNFDLAYKSLIDYVTKIDKSFINDKKITRDEYHIDLYNLWIKAIMHSYTLRQIIKGTFAENFNSTFYDYSSAYVVARALYESILIFFYIFIDYKSDDEKEFKYLLWNYCCYFERQRFQAFLPETIEKKTKEEHILKSIEAKILSSNYFLNSTPTIKKRITKEVLPKGNWKLDSLSNIGKKLGLSSHLYKDTYSLLCGYSHSGKHSVFQMNQARKNEERKNFMIVPNIVLCISLSNLIFLMYQIRNKINDDFKIELLQTEIDYYKYYLHLSKTNLANIK